jgi:hypothetical protein
MVATKRWAHFDGTATRPAPRDAANPTSAKTSPRDAPCLGASQTGFAGRMSPQNSKGTMGRAHRRVWAPGNPNNNTPEGVAPAEPDSMPRDDTNPNTDARAHLEGAGSQVSMDEEDHLVKVEEGIAGENASVEGDIGPCVELQNPSAPLPRKRTLDPSHRHHQPGAATPGLTTPMAPTQKTAARIWTRRRMTHLRQSRLWNNNPPRGLPDAGTSATPDKDSEEDTEETFRAETSGAEDEEALVKEEGWDADEEAGVTTLLVDDAPRTESTPVPHNVLHAPAPSHTSAAPGAPDEKYPSKPSPRAENTSPTR